ncbi:MAG TPA: sigma-70 family RNA polymerase sigma factor [Bacteroidota bacterium]|nr:sigma-70 family RNA polymerase sigma factor [Bacteroidota bacterium]
MEPIQEQTLELRVQRLIEENQLDRATLDTLSDEELMLLFQRDVRPAYDILVGRFKDPLMNYIYRFVGNSNDAADILQETFLRVYKKKMLYKTIARFSTWIYTIAGNLAKSELRKAHRKGHIPLVIERENDDDYVLPLHDEDPLPDRSANSALIYDRIHAALATLPEAFREAVILRDVQDLSYEEIAEIIEMPIGTVKSRINRGRAQLQELLKDLYE